MARRSDTKHCPYCNLDKPRSEFYQKETGHYGRCKPCFLAYKHESFNRTKAALVQYKGSKCFKCTRTGHPAEFDFHHRDPSTKDFAISAKHGYSFEALKLEVDKCDLICACCHRLEHINPAAWDFDWLDPFRPKQQPKFTECFCGAKIRNDRKFCSPNCFQRGREKIEWPENLADLVAKSSQVAVGKLLGVSARAVAKRLKRPIRESNPISVLTKDVCIPEHLGAKS